ncbi:flavin-containing monooxygenase FMO GS-OX-like 4 isoform X1 [Ziziphus jujuba]|uniref:Flavin-containing monooxygenase n=1 Tax=Ziziphus jujuba TaxID=326968 RepID=A0ABM4ACZ6_ZIZJJ|nr:flavin-containing monooxygenase FMO GS-OX-like 4 isoform X1 [Ziziphus jujuba]
MPLELPSIEFHHVAVIGAGASGLVAARELRREGHTAVVFERGDQIGGVWVYTPEVESDTLGVDPHRTFVHCSLYESLRTNLPRQVMGFRDYPFVVREDDDHERSRDTRRFPGHRDVLMYLQDFAREFGIDELVRLETEVVYVGMVESGKWKVKSRKRCGSAIMEEYFDAVVVCVGHYWEPRLAEISGIDLWPGKQMHSHNYRIPEPFRDKVVILIGNSVSANDISREIAGTAKEVHLACRTVNEHQTMGKQAVYNNMWCHPMIKSVHEDGTVLFQDGSVVLADFIMQCTGYRKFHVQHKINRELNERIKDIIYGPFTFTRYKYHFPFLDTNGIVTVQDNRVGPLYKHVFPPELAPWLSFVGLAWKVAPFPMFELQSKWIAGALHNRIALPSQKKMMADVKAFYSSLEASGKPYRYTHNISEYQFEYIDWLVAQCGAPAHEEWRKQMYAATKKSKITRPNSYRDEWEDQHLVWQANQDFIKFTVNKN